MTDDDIRAACRRARRGDEEAFKLIVKLAEAKHARAVILAYFCKPQTRGMPKGRVTHKGGWHRVVLEEMEDFIEQARAEGCKRPVEEGAERAAHWASVAGSGNAEDYAPDDPDREGLGLDRMGWGITAEQLLNARRRGKKKGGAGNAS